MCYAKSKRQFLHRIKCYISLCQQYNYSEEEQISYLFGKCQSFCQTVIQRRSLAVRPFLSATTAPPRVGKESDLSSRGFVRRRALCGILT